MDLWMYLVIIAMFLVATVGTVWITLWTIQRGEARRKAAEVVGPTDTADGAAVPRVVRSVSTRTISTATAKTTTDAASDNEAKSAG